MTGARARLVTLTALAVLLGGAVWAWPRLPAEIPLHFGLDGRPDRWGPASPWSWFGVPAVAIGMTLLFEGIRWTLSRGSGAGVRLPDGRRLSDLPEAERAHASKGLEGVLTLVHLEVLVILGMIQLATWLSAHGRAGEGLVLAALFLGLLSSPVFLVILVLRLDYSERST